MQLDNLIGRMTAEDMRVALETIAGNMNTDDLSEMLVEILRVDETLLDQTMSALEQQGMIEGGW